MRKELRVEDFGMDSHAAKYIGALEAKSEAFERLLLLLNDPSHEQRLIDAEAHGLPALAGVVRFIESDAVISRELTGKGGSLRFRQAVGVAVKLKMAKLGWRVTGSKGAVRGARHFVKAEHYAQAPDSDERYETRVLAVLDELGRIGDEAERERTRRELLRALARTRAGEGRPF